MYTMTATGVLLFVLSTLCCLNSITGQSSVCTDNTWTHFMGSCYKVFVSEDPANNLIFDNAEAACVTHGGHLVSITSASEDTFIQSILPGTGEYLWIGLKAEGSSQTEDSGWVWTDSSPFSYNNWKTGQPDSNSKDCVDIRDPSTKWEDYFCTTKNGFICEIPESVQTCPPLSISDPRGDITGCTPPHIENDVCTFECDEGYVVEGDVTRTCLSDGSWSGSNGQSCRAVACPTLVFEGDISCFPTMDVTYGTACTFTCPDGKEVISGNIIRGCEADEQWSGTMPTCAVVMCQPLSFPGGDVECSPNNYDYGTVCSFECPDGYEPDEPGLTMTCELDKEWSGRMPNTCQRVDCGAYPEIENGKDFCDDTKYESICSVICDLGYKIENSQSKCMADKQWSDPPLSCTRILCPPLNFDNQPGDMSCTPTGFGHPSTCSFICDDGHSLTGSPSLTCQQDGTWDNIVPTCKDVFCPAVSLEDGSVECPDGLGYAQTCTFKCHAPLTLYGEDETRCLQSGEWSNEVPQCKLFDPKCDDAISPSICRDNCETNRDCAKDEVCCESSCGLTCKKVKSSTKKGFKLDRNMLLLLIAGQQPRRRPRPRARPQPRPILPQCPVCNVNACSVTRCPTYLNALCGTSCNGCRAHFFNPYNNQIDITQQCQCPPNMPPNPACGGHMCNGVGCREFPGSQCRVYGCGQRCLLQFFDRYGRMLPCRSTISTGYPL